jgi:four helix bundle protein
MENSKSQNQTIKSFRDLRVYQNLYKAMIIVLKEIVPKLPKEEKYDLCDQTRRCCKAPCALLAEGFAKRYQRKNWQKYLDDCIGECNEMINHLSVCIDVYFQYVDPNRCKELIDIYDISNKQLYKLKQSWQDFHQLEK